MKQKYKRAITLFNTIKILVYIMARVIMAKVIIPLRFYFNFEIRIHVARLTKIGIRYSGPLAIYGIRLSRKDFVKSCLST